MDPYALNLGDFVFGHDTDPLCAPGDFRTWRAMTARERGLLQQPLAGASGPWTQLEVAGEARDVLNLASLDYLGLNRHPVIAAAIAAAVQEWGVGACGVPLLTGTSRPQKELERLMAELVGHEDAMLFPSGFSGGAGLMSALLHKGDVAIADVKAHMCWMDGIRTSGAHLATFPHGDIAALDDLLERHKRSRRLVVVDGLYSMDGDVPDLPALLDVCDAHNVGLVVDEAHSVFALGHRGGGTTESQGVEGRVRLFVGTFSKGLSMLGGFASASHDLLDYARFYAHPFAFSAALPPAYLVGIIAAAKLSGEGADLRARLASNAEYFRQALRTMGLDTGSSTTHVIPIIFKDRRFLFEAGLSLRERGVYVMPVDYPAVPEDAVRFRISISAGHTQEDLDRGLNAIEDVVAKPLRTRCSP
jgi:glycine C-acetyltransferase